MSSRKVNILVYAGNGTTLSSVRHTTWSLRRIIGPNYAVVTVTGDQILKEPWTTSCALLVIPGGADLAFSRTLNGLGTRRIKQYVQMGGAYLGFCAGGYYGSARCEFEVGKAAMEVVGDRELAFFPGTCRGLAFPGFEYNSEAGARAAKLSVIMDNFKDTMPPASFKAYYNGGGVFVDAASVTNAEILASYDEELAVHSGQGHAAIVFCKVGEGSVILTGPHPEFSGLNLNRNDTNKLSTYNEVVDDLIADEEARIQFMRACLVKLGLEVSADVGTPTLSRLHLSAAQPGRTTELLQEWKEQAVLDKTGRTILGENDTFVVVESENASWDLDNVLSALEVRTGDSVFDEQDKQMKVKQMICHTQLPELKETPHFNHRAFFSSLQDYHSRAKNRDARFGTTLLYGEVVTSTSTMLEKNVTWLSHLPDGFTATATTQVQGRGRGSNVWVSPPGSLMFSTVIRHSLALSNTAPVVFIQYLAALAIVNGIHQYDRGYDKLPVRLKWPNDIYALDPATEAYVKIGGILVNSSYAGGDYTLVCGIGLNVNNAAPTTSITRLASEGGLPAVTVERLLAAILAQFELLYTRFCRTGFDKWFEDLYYRHWLHSDQIVTLETENGAKARIKGITTDWGLLVAEELGWEDRPTGRTFMLQSDSNSFDFFKGLLRRKM